jgi:hypothetical protein
MAAVDDLDQVLEQFHLAVGELLKGNPEPVKKLWSHRDDVSLANPFGPPVRGWEQVAQITEHAASVKGGSSTPLVPIWLSEQRLSGPRDDAQPSTRRLQV